MPCWAEWGRSSGYAVINISKSAPSEIDKTLAIKLLPIGYAGVYSIAARVVGALTLPVIAMLLAALPRLFGGEREKSAVLLLWMYGAAFLYSVTLAGLLWLSAPLLSLVFSESYQGLSEIVRLLCYAVPAVAIRMVAGNALMATRSPWLRVCFEGLGILLLVTGSIVLTSLFGYLGLPFAVILSEWIMALVGGGLSWYVLRRPHQ
jgi:O-antigen/teichoic acid export membrane protein